MKLAEISAGAQCRVQSAADENKELQSRLYALGVYPGVKLDVLRFAPTGDPMQVRVGGTLISIRKQEAEHIFVEATT
ncbi:MAG: FeoA family protein [Pseudomonadales bacterium]|jgi:ferrous iron transport protein A|tara:strand:- start:8068 stop:8298 length:231 start_codon:yes stop_codon:yes gene_type:complete